jgi:chromosome segregation ATPase
MNKENEIIMLLEQVIQKQDKMERDLTRKFDAIEKRFDAIEGRLDTIEGRLDTIEGRLDTIEGRLDTIEGRLDTIEDRLDAIEERYDAFEEKTDNSVAYIKKETTKVAIIIENEIRPNIQRLAEGFGTIATRLDYIEPVVTDVNFNVSIIKKVVTAHSTDINRLKSAV